MGGIRHYNPGGKGDIPEDSARHFATMQESLQIFAGDPLVAKPGTKFNYSTYGYTLLGNIFLPAGMEQTREDDFFTIVPHRTRWYHKDKAGIVRNAGVLDSSYKIPGGGLISSAADMARFEAGILADKRLQRGTRDLRWTSLKTADGKATGYGLGWGIYISWHTRAGGRGRVLHLRSCRSAAPASSSSRTWMGGMPLRCPRESSKSFSF